MSDRWVLAGPGLIVLLAVISCSSLANERATDRGVAEAPTFAPDYDRVDARCAFPAKPDTIRAEADAVLLEWEFRDAPIYKSFALPDDQAFTQYRAAVRADGADVRHPVSDDPARANAEQAELWKDERTNAELARTGEAGLIEPIRCLDALLFATQNRRIRQLERPTEFLASVLRMEVAGEPRLVVLFGAGDEMFPPKSVYGFDVVNEYVALGWRYEYALHNHTIQKNGDRLALGTPALSTSDVQLSRNLVETTGLESVRVTNGFYTYRVGAEDLGLLRSR